MSAIFPMLPVSPCHPAMQQDGSTTKPCLNPPCCRASSVFSVKYVFSPHYRWPRLGELWQTGSWHMAMARMIIDNDFVNTAHHLGSQWETQIRICLTTFMWRSFRLQEEQLDIYSRPMMLEVAWGVGEDDAITHPTYHSILQELSGKERPILFWGW